MHSTLIALMQKIQKNSKRKKHYSSCFLANRKRCKSTYQQAAENVSKAKSGSKAELIHGVITRVRGPLVPEML